MAKAVQVNRSVAHADLIDSMVLYNLIASPNNFVA